ncbi:hypothetical protein N7519_005920 [Penicillium mononematosum]|uniref:uncharacterized protein n=1 Tax=Penicillium mononematosum TaxID=268346 RepID=UPI002546D2E0|nr:uncharacterized protein N7519_005920 [Penicillium mononematosum]KAJ6184619.1 hypothetical protein N7519_005920 [Penicillium mononematosum]
MDPRCPRKWTRKEDSILRSEVGVYQSKSQSRTLRYAVAKIAKDTSSPIPWTAISTKLPGRNNKDCRKRWYKMADAYRKGPWTEEEDQSLLQAISAYGTRWNQVSQHVGTRNADQCAKHWQHSLDPSIDRSPWTAQDDEALLSAVLELGRAWRLVASTKFPFRSPTDLKNRYELVCRRLQNTVEDQSSTQLHRALPDLDELMNLGSSHHYPEYSSNFEKNELPDLDELMNQKTSHHNPEYSTNLEEIQPFVQHHHELSDLHGLMNLESFPNDPEYPYSDPEMVDPSLLPLTPESELPPRVDTDTFCSKPSLSKPIPLPCNRPSPSAVSSPSYTLIVNNIDPTSVGDLMHSLMGCGLMLDMRLQRQTDRFT